MAHTPGPWTVEDPMGPDTLAIVPAGRPTHEWVIIAACSDDEDEPNDRPPRISRTERDANARLIAAAPELLAALKAARRIIIAAVTLGVDMPGFDPAQHSVVVMISAAIAKAEGTVTDG